MLGELPMVVSLERIQVLKDGIASAFEEHGVPPLYSATPDLDQATPGVIKTLHSSFREKRCKERSWMRV